MDRSSEDNTGHMGDGPAPGRKNTMNLVRHFELKLVEEKVDNKKIVQRTKRKARRRFNDDGLVQTRISHFVEINGEKPSWKTRAGGGSMVVDKNGALLSKRKLEDGEDRNDKREKKEKLQIL